ncbi:Nucleotidyltransferase-like [Marininema mesophilum]|uniref:Nucleotidyltransferase-like n=1 Tax=Marininema mesophilum TaxID=1048340 RepID=A0A1H3D2Y1_9BACL|nr:nucleotidyltransferase-like protein [Marininema mesophilum]SDX60747.1 Nucleotidyltransferase-like [Marininema mesophilum]
MKDIVYPVLKQRVNESGGTRGALVVPTVAVQLIDVRVADLLLIVLCEEEKNDSGLSTYVVDTWKVKEVHVQATHLEKELLIGGREDLIPCFLYGEILVDPNQYLEAICTTLRDLPPIWKEKKMCIEYANVLEGYLATQVHLNSGYLMDAFATIQEGLQHWGRLVIIEAGGYPEISLWRQVKPVEPALYKLNYELIHGNDSIEKRIRLVLLATEYSMISKLKNYTSFLLELMRDERGTWSIEKLSYRLAMEQMTMDPTLLIEELVKRSVLEEVVLWEHNRAHHRYRYISETFS